MSCQPAVSEWGASSELGRPAGARRSPPFAHGRGLTTIATIDDIPCPALPCLVTRGGLSRLGWSRAHAGLCRWLLGVVLAAGCLVPGSVGAQRESSAGHPGDSLLSEPPAAEAPVANAPSAAHPLAASPAADTPAAEPSSSRISPADTFAQAWGHLWRGRYAEAAELFAAQADRQSEAALGLARSLAARGRLDEAEKALLPWAETHASAAAELARLAFQRGRYPEARRRAEAALELEKDHPLARWTLAELDRVAGRLKEAESGYRQLIRYYNSHDELSAEQLHWIGLGAAQYARWHRLADQFDFLVNELYPDALRTKPDFWPAHYQAGLLFLEKYNFREAADELHAALRINPQAAEVHAALGRLALEQHDLRRAEQHIARALEINPRLLDAWLVRADLLWSEEKTAEVLELLRGKAVPLNPFSEETLGRLAACYLLLDRPKTSPLDHGGAPGPRAGQAPGGSERFEELLADVEGRNKHAGTFYFTLARQLEQRNKLPEAEHYLLRAMQLMPELLGPQAYLGQVYMRWGREQDARAALERAFRDDPYHVRAHNFLQVLDLLDQMETRPTEHAVLKYSAQSDRLLATCAAEYVDRLWPELCRKFDYRPREKVLVEFFSQSQGHSGQTWLAARMAGVPQPFTVGASTGMIVGMVSPCEAAKRGYAFNWQQVLRHELVHVVTLRRTHCNMPRWFTEGLAVHSEGAPRPAQWNRLLHMARAQGELLDLGSIDEAYTRPGDQQKFQLAYCQGELYVEYMLKRGGWQAVLRMVEAYASGLQTAEAVAEVFGTSLEEFETDYRAFVDQVLDNTPALPWPEAAEVDKLLAQARQKPDDAALSARLALAYLRRGAWQEAREAAQRSRRLDPKQALAAYVLASLMLRDGGTQAAVELLEQNLDPEQPHPLVLSLLASLRLKAKQYDQAAELYALGQRLDATTSQWSANLARTWLLAGRREQLAETLRRLAEQETDNILFRLKLAQLALEDKDFVQAADWARKARQIDPADPRALALLGRALAGAEQWEEAARVLQWALELQEADRQLRLTWARALVETGRKVQARRVLERLLADDPQDQSARKLLAGLEEEQ